MIIDEGAESMLGLVARAGPLMWISDAVPWPVFDAFLDLSGLGLVERGPAIGSVQLTDLGRSYAFDVLALATA